MKPIKLTSLLLMLLVASTAFGQEVFMMMYTSPGKRKKRTKGGEKGC